MVPPSSNGISRAPPYSGSCRPARLFVYVTFTLFRRSSHIVRLKLADGLCSPKPHRNFSPWFGLFRVRSPLLTESRLISLPHPTEMFQFGWFPSHRYLIHDGMHELLHADCSIRKSTDRSVFTAPRSLSQLTTSFIGSQCQGIHSTLFPALPFALVLLRNFRVFTNCSFFTRHTLFSKICRFYFVVSLASILFSSCFCPFQEQISTDKNPLISILAPDIWWAQMDLNHRPHAYQACALTS